MKTWFLLPCWICWLVPIGCSSVQSPAGERPVPSVADAREAVDALQTSRFEDAERLAKELLIADDRNAQAHLVAAITRYKRAMHQLTTDVVAIGAGAFVQGLNRQYLAFALQAASGELAAVEDHLARAARDPAVVLEQCLACWEVDWNRSGQVDDRDRLLFEIEQDAAGEPIASADPRRRPTFRFDLGDVYWARAMLAFQRALIELLAAYELPEPRALMQRAESRDPEGRRVVFQLKDREAIRRMKQQLLDGLAHADRCRREYLAETDDEREWVPNPRQHDHPLPLPVDETLYATWEGVLSDLRGLIGGSEGLGVAELAQLGDHQWADPPGGFIDVGALLAEPADIVLDLDHAERLDRDATRTNAEAVLADVFGAKYRPGMRPSQLVSRLARMKAEVERGQESFERKLRYLFWLN